MRSAATYSNQPPPPYLLVPRPRAITSAGPSIGWIRRPDTGRRLSRQQPHQQSRAATSSSPSPSASINRRSPCLLGRLPPLHLSLPCHSSRLRLGSAIIIQSMGTQAPPQSFSPEKVRSCTFFSICLSLSLSLLFIDARRHWASGTPA